jgi:hypothetical protein
MVSKLEHKVYIWYLRLGAGIVCLACGILIIQFLVQKA